MKTILIVDDELQARTNLKYPLEKNYHILEAESGEEAVDIVQNSKVDIVLLDIWMDPGIRGTETLEKIKGIDKDIEVVMTTSDTSIEMINKCVAFGVHNYLKKPINVEDLNIVLQIASQNRDKNIENILKDKIINNIKVPAIVGEKEEMKKVQESIKKAGPYHAITVFITGESGTGKELVARALHKEFNDKKRPFVIVNCGAIPATLVESELFGYEKGAFTGANSRKIGSFELANNGDIFLDEICEMPMETQVKLLRVLNDKKFSRVGGTQIVESNFRLIAATNKNITELIDTGKFREDLYYRINGYRIHLPPLRERKSDIPLLAHALLNEISEKLNRKNLTLSDEVIQYFETQDWKGNIRALKNVLESMVINSDQDNLTLMNLSTFQPKYTLSHIQEKLMIKHMYEKSIAAGLFNTLSNFEQEILRVALNEHRTMMEASESLGISKSTFSEKVKKYNLQDE